jgi:hypothetical protein
MLIKFDIPRTEVNAVAQELRKDQDLIRTGIMPLQEHESDFQATCQCAEKGEFVKNEFNYEKPMTSWDKKRIFKNYGLRL